LPLTPTPASPTDLKQGAVPAAERVEDIKWGADSSQRLKMFGTLGPFISSKRSYAGQEKNEIPKMQPVVSDGKSFPFVTLQPGHQTSYAEGYYDDFVTDFRGQGMGGAYAGCTGPLIKRFQDKLGRVRLDVGPLFNPSFEPCNSYHAVYWDCDAFALNRIAKEQSKNVHCLHVDLNYLSQNPKEHDAFVVRSRELLGSIKSEGFDSIILSQVLNYIDFSALLALVSSLQAPGGLLLVYNAINIGTNKYFHAQRPKSNQEIIANVSRSYDIIHLETRREHLELVAKRNA
jgi:hypothetical protein